MTRCKQQGERSHRNSSVATALAMGLLLAVAGEQQLACADDGAADAQSRAPNVVVILADDK